MIWTGPRSRTADAQSITSSWSGVDYSIDLSKANADKFEKAIGPYLEKARRVGGRKNRQYRFVELSAGSRYQGGPGLGRIQRHRTVQSRPVPADVIEKYKLAGD